mgnify:CR=1 FL=1
MKIFKTIILIVIFLTFSLSIYAQDPLNGRDLSTLKVETLSENQISAIQQKLKQSGMTIDQVESQAIAKGMPPSEFAKLKERVNGSVGIVMSQKKSSNSLKVTFKMIPIVFGRLLSPIITGTYWIK